MNALGTVVSFPSQTTRSPSAEDIDDELIERIAMDDEGALVELEERHVVRLRQIAIAILADDDDADAVIDDVFIDVVCLWAPERGEVARWLGRLTRKHARKRRAPLGGLVH